MRRKDGAILVACVLACAVSVGALAAAIRGNTEHEKVLTAWDYHNFVAPGDDFNYDDEGTGIITTKEYYELEDLKEIRLARELHEIGFVFSYYNENKDLVDNNYYDYPLEEYIEEDIQTAIEYGGVYFKITITDDYDEDINFLDKVDLTSRVQVVLVEGCNAELFE